MTITQRNLDGYGAPPIEWDRVYAVLDTQFPQAPGTGGPQRHTTWLTTINPDGSPHVMAVGVIRCMGSWYFTEPFDLVAEGVTERVTDADELTSVAAAYAADQWPARVEGDAITAEYSAPSAGPPPWYLYRIKPSTVFALGTSEPGGATKFHLD
jgi:hypothetical protein